VSDIEQLAAMLAGDQLTTTKLVDGTGVILDVDSMQVFTLNETGMFLVEQMRDGATEGRSLVEKLVEAFDVEDGLAAADVDTFVGDLAGFLTGNKKR
jgi:hypothetical protein